jgi:hypothetical protein
LKSDHHENLFAAKAGLMRIGSSTKERLESLTFIFNFDLKEVWCPPKGTYKEDPTVFHDIPEGREVSKISFTIVDDPQMDIPYYVESLGFYENEDEFLTINVSDKAPDTL